MYHAAASELRSRGVAPHEVLYVGNDVRNDVLPAATVGFRTVLFAGDNRSLRWRADDPLVLGVEPDAVITDLMQIPQICGF
jgi:putative hydrolase of the HAD superfamily